MQTTTPMRRNAIGTFVVLVLFVLLMPKGIAGASRHALVAVRAFARRKGDPAGTRNSAARSVEDGEAPSFGR